MLEIVNNERYLDSNVDVTTPYFAPTVTKVFYIIDLSVLVRNIDSAIVKVMGSNPSIDSQTYNRLLTAMLVVNLCSPASLDLLADNLEFAVILAKDSKPYWRSAVYPKYKGNRRKVPSQLFTRLKYSISVADRLVEKLGLGTSIAFEHFEADDIAAGYAKFWRERRGVPSNCGLVLCTNDTDWCGLISDEDLIIWVEMSSAFTPYVRDELNFQVWCNHKKPPLKCKTPAAIYRWKQVKGDPSDNLPAGCDFNLIDLISPTVNLFDQVLPLPETFFTKAKFQKILVESNKYIAKATNAAKLIKFEQIRLD